MVLIYYFIDVKKFKVWARKTSSSENGECFNWKPHAKRNDWLLEKINLHDCKCVHTHLRPCNNNISWWAGKRALLSLKYSSLHNKVLTCAEIVLFKNPFNSIIIITFAIQSFRYRTDNTAPWMTYYLLWLFIIIQYHAMNETIWYFKLLSPYRWNAINLLNYYYYYKTLFTWYFQQ